MQSDLLSRYGSIVGEEEVRELYDLAAPFRGKEIVHVNSTKQGGGVAELLNSFVPLMNELGMRCSWEVMEGNQEFYHATKTIHNGLQGNPVEFTPLMKNNFEETGRQNAQRLKSKLENADLVIIHDPQPASLLHFCDNRKGKWIWRCHIDAATPHPEVWDFVNGWVEGYDASVFSMEEFLKPMAHQQKIICPSIDPLSPKNALMDILLVARVCRDFDIDICRPVMLQVSRYDYFKDPIGVIRAYRLVKKEFPDVQLVLAGGGADDDPEGQKVLEEVYRESGGDEDIHILLLPPDAHLTINALQRAATVVLQKSLREGFGLTVSEALWKRKPVIGGDTGGIRLQIDHEYNGYRVKSYVEAAQHICTLLSCVDTRCQMGERAYEHVRENFLVTKSLRKWMNFAGSLA